MLIPNIHLISFKNDGNCQKAKGSEVSLTLQEELAQNVSLEQGKTIADAHGDVFRGLGKTS